jgi:hypothetical protein
MATLRLDNVQLKPGDIVMVQYELTGANETLTGLAVHQIKQTLANDARFNYQGSEVGEAQDADENTLSVLNIYVQVRKTPRQERVEVQQAGVGIEIVIGVVALVALISGAIIAHSGQIKERCVTVNGILASGESDAVKIEALKAAGADAKTGIGTGIAALGGGLVTAALVLGGLWLLSQRKSS